MLKVTVLSIVIMFDNMLHVPQQRGHGCKTVAIGGRCKAHRQLRRHVDSPGEGALSSRQALLAAHGYRDGGVVGFVTHVAVTPRHLPTSVQVQAYRQAPAGNSMHGFVVDTAQTPHLGHCQ